jgi:hypothetical protein
MSTWTTEDRKEAEKTMNNEPALKGEPVAWMYEKSNGASKLSFVKEKMLWEDMTETPLYTHPAKTLTDEEIDYEFDDFVWTGNRKADFELIARAILRKAQEK